MSARGPIKSQTFEVLKAHGVPVETVLDVGVLTGTPELVTAFPDRLHILFEPVAEFAPAISAAYAGVQHRRVDAAVGAHEGEVALQVISNIDGVEITHSHMADPAPDRRTVPLVTLDGYLAREPAAGPYLLKIDIDGHELLVVQGATETLKQTSVVVIETPVYAFSERIAALEARGFVLFDLAEPCYYDGAFWQCDAVMLRAELKAAHFADLHRSFDPALYRPFTG